MKSHRHNKVERRHAPDAACKCVNKIALCGWILAAISVVIIYVAKPGYFWDRDRKLANPYFWNLELAGWYCAVMWLCFITSLMGIYINKKRVKRKTDSYCFNLIILAIISFCSIVGYYIYF